MDERDDAHIKLHDVKGFGVAVFSVLVEKKDKFSADINQTIVNKVF